MPKIAKTFLEIAETKNAGHFVELVKKSNLINDLNSLKNVTIFLPTDEASEVSDLFMQIAYFQVYMAQICADLSNYEDHCIIISINAYIK